MVWDSGAIKRAGEVIEKGGLVLFPSDTVYILAVDPTNQKAVDKLLGFKNRWAGKAISVAVSDVDMAQQYVELSDNGKNVYANLLPGPFTVISNGKGKMAKGIEAENGTLGIRIPDNGWIINLVTVLGKPVTATSANLAGRRPHYSVESFWKTLSTRKKEMVDLIVDGGKLPRNKPSTVIDTTKTEIEVLRRGDLVTTGATGFLSKSDKETEKLGQFLWKKAIEKVGDGRPLVLALSGELGSGKTVFTRGVARILGIRDKIVSPTFNICNEYNVLRKNKKDIGNYKKLVHYDLYRLSSKSDFEEIGFLNQFINVSAFCIEWPENMGKDMVQILKQKTKWVGVRFEYRGPREREIFFELP